MNHHITTLPKITATPTGLPHSGSEQWKPPAMGNLPVCLFSGGHLYHSLHNRLAGVIKITRLRWKPNTVHKSNYLLKFLILFLGLSVPGVPLTFLKKQCIPLAHFQIGI